MLRKVINRKNITIIHDFGDGRDWNTAINLQFQPDEMIVKAISAQGSVVPIAGGLEYVYCETINEILGSFSYNSFVYPNLQFMANRFPINSQWNFKILNATTQTLNTTFDSEIMIHLEFIQYQ